VGDPVNTERQAAGDHPTAAGKIAGEAASVSLPEGGHAPRADDRQLRFSQGREVPFYVKHGRAIRAGQQGRGIGRMGWGEEDQPAGLCLFARLLKLGLRDRFQEPRREARAGGPGKRSHPAGAQGVLALQRSR